MKKIVCISLMCALVFIMMPRAAWSAARGTSKQTEVPPVIEVSPGTGDLFNITVRWIHAPETANEGNMDRVRVKWIKKDGTEMYIVPQPSDKVEYGHKTRGHRMIVFKGVDLPIDELRYSSFVFEFDDVVSDPIPVSPFSDEPWVFMPYKDGDTLRIACIGKFNEYRYPDANRYKLAVLRQGGGQTQVGTVHIKERMISTLDAEQWLVAETTLEEASQYAINKPIEFIAYDVSYSVFSPVCRFVYADQKIKGANVSSTGSGTYSVRVHNRGIDAIVPAYTKDFVESVNSAMTVAARVNALDEMKVSLISDQDTPVQYLPDGTLKFTKAMSGDKKMQFKYMLENYNLGNSLEMDFCQMSFSGDKPLFCSGVSPLKPGVVVFRHTIDEVPDTDESGGGDEVTVEDEATVKDEGTVDDNIVLGVDEVDVEDAPSEQVDSSKGSALQWGGGACSFSPGSSVALSANGFTVALLIGAIAPIGVLRRRRRVK